MDVYTLGRLVFPGVISILIVAAILMLVTVSLTILRLLASTQHLVQPMEEAKRMAITINIFPKRRSSPPPMQEKG